MLHTTIIHDLRSKYSLSIAEYCVLDAIHFLSTNPKAPIAGWCNASKSYIGDSLGLSKGFVVGAITVLEEHGLIEKNDDGRLLRITQKYFDEHGQYKSGGNQTDRIGNRSDRNRSSIRPPSKTLDNTLVNTDVVETTTTSELFEVQGKKKGKQLRSKSIYPDYQQFLDIWSKFYPTIALKFPRDGRMVNELIAETGKQVVLRGLEDVPATRVEWWGLFVANLHSTWAHGSILPTINKHYPSLIKIIEDGKGKKRATDGGTEWIDKLYGKPAA